MTSARKKQRGFTIIELLVAMVVGTIITIVSVPMVVAKIEDSGMEGTGAYMAMIKTGLERYNLRNYDALAAGTAQTVVTPALANAYAPTIDELVRDRYIVGNSISDLTPQRQRIRTQITTPNCPGPDCVVQAIAFTTTPLVYTGTAEPRFDLLSTYLASPAVAGSGLITKQLGNGSLLQGNSGLSVANPLGTVPGILAITTNLDQAFYASFVRRLDTRDPDLRGGMTLSGTLPSGNTLQVNGSTNITGSATVATNLRAGSLTINQIGVVGGACTDLDSMVQGVIAGVPVLLKCQAGIYVATGINIATVGAGCSIDAQFAQTIAGSNLVCADGRYRIVNDLFGKQGVMNIAVYSHGDVVPTPTCGPTMVPVLAPMGVVSACVVGGGTCLNNTGSFRGAIEAGNVVSITGSNGAQAGSAQMTVASLCSTS